MKFNKRVSIFIASMMLFNVLSGSVLLTTKVKAEVMTYKPLSGDYDDFITRDVDKLMDGDEKFRFISFAVPELAMNESPFWRISSPFDQEDAIKSIAAMGGKVTRPYVLSVKKADDEINTQRHIMGIKDGKLIFNEEAFVAYDNVLALSHQYGVRLIVPFVDQWNWWGGINEYNNFAGLTKSEEFWTNEEVRGYFKQTIEYMMNRTNTITGIKYKNDPAILAWETGNELSAKGTDEWTEDIVTYIKSMEPKQLIMDGRYGVIASSLDNPDVDIVNNHYYNGDDYAARNDVDRNATKGKKALIIGEFGIAETSKMQGLVDKVIENGTTGAMVWSLRQHKPEGGFFSHYEYDGYWSYHVPGFTSGDDYDELNIVNMIRDGAAKINGLNETPQLPVPDAPKLLPITSVANLNWQGSVGASGYGIERADSASGPWIVVGTNVSDSQIYGVPLFHDTTAVTGNSYYYKINATNESGTSAYSDVVGPIVAKHIIEDDMYGFSNIYLKTNNIQVTGSKMKDFGNDYNRLVKTSNATAEYAESIVYASPKALALGTSITTYFKASDTADFTFQTSEDNDTFVSVSSTKVEDVIAGSTIKKVTYTFNSFGQNDKFLKISFPTVGTPEIGRADIEYTHDGGDLTQIKPAVMSGVITDDLNNYSNIYKKSENLSFDTTNESVEGDTSLLKRTSNTKESITYKTFGDLNSFRATSYFGNDDVEGFTFSTSVDGTTFAPYTPTLTELSGEWKKNVYETYNLPARTRYLKVEFPISTKDEDSWTPLLSKVELGVGAIQIARPINKATNIIDTFETYGGSSDIVSKEYIRNVGGDQVVAALSDAYKSGGTYGMKYEYQLGASGYAGMEKLLNKADYSGYNTLRLWIKGDGSGNGLTFQFLTKEGRYWEAHYDMAVGDTTGKFISIPFSDFKQPSWDQKVPSLELVGMVKFAIYVGGNNKEKNSVYFDDIQVSNPLSIENGDTYSGDNTELNKKWALNPGGDVASMSLNDENFVDGKYGIKLDYELTTKGYSGLMKKLNAADYTGTTVLKFWIKPDGSGNDLTFQFKDKLGHYWEAKYIMADTTAGFVSIPYSDFKQPSWDTSVEKMDISGMSEFAIYIGGSSKLANTVYLDAIQVANASTEVTAAKVAAGIISVVAPNSSAKKLILPTVPYGYSIAIKSTTPEGVIATDGTITAPEVETTVAVIFTVTNTENNTTADTVGIDVVVPEMQTGPVVVPVITFDFEDGETQGWGKGNGDNFDATTPVEFSNDLSVTGNTGALKINANYNGSGPNETTISIDLKKDLSDYDTLDYDVYVPKTFGANTLTFATIAKLGGGWTWTENVVFSGDKEGVDISLEPDTTIDGVKYAKIHRHLTKGDVPDNLFNALLLRLTVDNVSYVGAIYVDDISISKSSGSLPVIIPPVVVEPTVVEQVKRLSGANRIETSIAIAREQYTDTKPGAVVLATANDFADALAGSGLAYKYNAPMLLVNKTVGASQSVMDYITTNLSKDKTIYILGETGVISKEVSDYLAEQGYKIVRLGGKDRYETNKKIIDYLNVDKGTSLVIATGNVFADALSISSIADIKGFLVLLNNKDNLSGNAVSYITNLEPTTVYIVGGEGALSTKIETQIKKLNGNITIVRLGGEDRYETSMMIFDYFDITSKTITVATGVNFPDALSGSVLAARKNSGLLLINNKNITKQKELLSKEKITNVIVFGGEGVIRSDIATSLIQK